ncbi:MAG: RelA/SpoT family protein [Rikenellaceae bacterium]
MEYNAEDEALIAGAWERLQASCRRVERPEADWDLIRRAYCLAKEAHHGVRRRSGEPYFLHPISVAQIVVDEIGLGAKSVSAALLHDVVEDTDYTVEDMERIFGSEIAKMVDGLTKISGLNTPETSEQAESFRKVILTLSDDVRVILIKIADRLHNMRTLGSMPHNKQIKITSETIFLFAPLAYRLGLFSIKSELEDLSMMYRYPAEYKHIVGKLKATQQERDELIRTFKAPIIDMLDRYGIKYEISGRVKSVYSIWSKMQRKQIPFEEIYDLFAVRIIFQALPFPPEKTQCWQIYGSITDIYKPNTDRLRDWISIPKANGYEALHATVMGPGGVWVEVQLRTQRMNDIAELGVAAHWKYKQLSERSQIDDELDKWLKKIRDALNSPSESAIDFIDNFKLALYDAEIVVFTPKGESRKMPRGATALDFAYDIHSKIGNRAIGAKINHKVQPVTATLNSGDQIDIITSESAEPRAEWLEYVTTSKATQAIKSFLKSDRENNIERGRLRFERELAKLEVPISSRVMRKVLPAYKTNGKDEFYNKIGAGLISLEDLDKVLKFNDPKKMLKFWSLFINKSESEDDIVELADSKQVATTKIAPVGQVEEEFVIAECCLPIPGDAVVGFRNYVDNRIYVHKSTCNQLHRLAAQFGNHIIKEEIKWSQTKSESYLCSLAIRGVDRTAMLLDLVKAISSDFNINMREVKVHSHNGIFEGVFSLYIKDIESLGAVIENLGRQRGVESVKRIEVLGS